MPAEPELIVAPNSSELAADVTSRLLDVLATAQRQFGRAVLALTAGSIMEAVWSAVAASDGGGVDWSLVDVCWADERFVVAGSPDRNDGPAGQLLFDREPFTAARQFPMPTADGKYGDNLEAAAAGYAEQLRSVRRKSDTGDVPSFDVILLGVGPDGHCASLFPHHPGVYDNSGDPVLAIRNSPKPPPLRISLSFAGLDAAEQIWFVASGTGKADAVAKAWSGADRVTVPSAGPRGRQRTLWLVDTDAAGSLANR